MNVKEVRNQRRVFFELGKDEKAVIVNIDKIVSIYHKENKLIVNLDEGDISYQDEDFAIFNLLGNALVNDFVEIKPEKEQG